MACSCLSTTRQSESLEVNVTQEHSPPWLLALDLLETVKVFRKVCVEIWSPGGGGGGGSRECRFTLCGYRRAKLNFEHYACNKIDPWRPLESCEALSCTSNRTERRASQILWSYVRSHRRALWTQYRKSASQEPWINWFLFEYVSKVRARGKTGLLSYKWKTLSFLQHRACGRQAFLIKILLSWVMVSNFGATILHKPRSIWLKSFPGPQVEILRKYVCCLEGPVSTILRRSSAVRLWLCQVPPTSLQTTQWASACLSSNLRGIWDSQAMSRLIDALNGSGQNSWSIGRLTGLNFIMHKTG